ncbi:MAG TPA: hypothetical protein VHA55_10070 [Pseudorhodoplanes sp.]|nr:hypothetical protein [Pseudorhodoplanes sp.]
MTLFGFFRRTPPIRDKTALADFIDEQAAFLVQKGMYEYSRARAGPHAKKMMFEDEFHRRIDESRWTAYPLGLAMVAEMVEGVLHPHAPDRHALLEALSSLVLGIFDRYPQPAALGVEAWAAARADLALRLARIAAHPPKRVIDIPEPYAEKIFKLMPIHESMRSPDTPTTRNFLKLNLVHMHEELRKRIEAGAMARLLISG